MQNAQALQTDVLEQGSIAFLDRPRELDDMQRLLILLSPANSSFERLIAIGRKRRDRFWGFVDLVLTPYDMNAALGAQVYGPRHLPAARVFAEGTYEVETHGPHSHLRWSVDRVEDEIPLERDADYIVTIANPDPVVWGLIEAPDLQSQLFDDLELHVPIPTPFPPSLQQRFRNRKFAELDTIDWLDHPGTELVFVTPAG